MKILHALIFEQQLYLWGEGAPVPAKGRKRVVPRHPGALRAPELLEWVTVSAGVGPPAELSVWCPSHAQGPVPSHPVLGVQPDEGLTLAAWQIDALPLQPLAWIEYLCRLPETGLVETGVMMAPELRYLQQLVRWVGKCLAEQQFLPVLEGSRALWQPFWAHNSLLFEAWAEAMPASLRAVAPTTLSAQQLLAQLLGQWCDALVRVAETEPFVSPGVAGSIFDDWMMALRQPLGDIARQPAEFEPLRTSLQAWQHPLRVMAEAPYRLCFQLAEPSPEGHWRLSAQVQSLRDLSLRIPLAEAWKPDQRGAKMLQHHERASLKEYLLMAMGQACVIFSPLEEMLQRQIPHDLVLSTQQAWNFLSEAAAALEQAGFGVLLPSAWTGSQARVTFHVKVTPPQLKAQGQLDLASIMQVNWQVALGDEPMTLQELRALAKLKVPLVQFRGQWRQVNAAEIQKALDFLQRQSQQLSLQTLVPMALGASDAPLPITQIVAQGAVKKLFAQLQGEQSFALQAVPKAFKGTLRPYQVRGYSWLQFLHRWGLGACLADDMGLGKTPQTLAHVLQARQAQAKAPPVLLVCPTTLVGNWKKEALRFAPSLKVYIHHGAERLKAGPFKKAIANQDVVITTYGLLQRDLPFISPLAWQGVVLDEAQNIKNAETQQSKATRSLKSQWRLALTGTPLENHVGDLWALMDFLNPGLLGHLTEFKRNFHQPIQVHRNHDALERLKQRVEPFMLRRVKTDQSIIADLPEKLEMELYCPLTREQATLYQAVLRDIEARLADSEGIQRKGIVLSALTRLKQLCNHPALFLNEPGPLAGRSGKLLRLQEMLIEVGELNEAALIFTQFAEMGGLLQAYLQDTLGQEVLLLTGATPKAKRDHMVERFQSPDGPKIFVLSLKAGGTGLNLTRANHVFHFDRWWNPAIENQATDRAFRIGQTRQVQVHKFICSGTLEDRIAEMLRGKQDLAQQAIGSGENWLTELSNKQLRELFQLNQAEAVSE